MDHILRSHHELNGPAGRNMKRIDFFLAAPMLDLPHPLLSDDIDLKRIRGGLKESNVEIRTPEKEAKKHQKRREGPGDFEAPGFMRGLTARRVAARMVAEHVNKDQPIHEREYRS